MTRTTFTKITPKANYLLISIIHSTCILKMRTGFRMLDGGFWMLETGCLILDVGYGDAG